ncbi:MAG: GntR family transcriptional regulator [Xanthomonadales bacterium]|jgi:DNA-binding GntR family transcriptional regulator|nr:GntR family transcriptional regulator [Xanthomonadales bacterium]
MNEKAPCTATPLSLADQAYELLEHRLVTLELAPGSTVSEGLLIDMVGLGRTPVREAMQRLAYQDLIRVMPRKGLMIVPIQSSDMLLMLEVRKRLERLIVKLAALNARDEQRSGLSAIARGLSISHDSFEEFLSLDRETDQLLDACAGNPFASTAVAPMRIHCRRFWYFYRNELRLSDAITAHSAMLRLIARRDYKGAQKASDGVITVIERLVASIQ